MLYGALMFGPDLSPFAATRTVRTAGLMHHQGIRSFAVAGASLGALLGLVACSGDARSAGRALGEDGGSSPRSDAGVVDAGVSLTPFDVTMFRDPPRELGPHVRWWWPGGAVDDATIATELDRIAAAGFGGVELQTLSFGMTADEAGDPRVRSVGQPAYLEHVRTFLKEARARSLHTSLTLGSGWPSGGTFSTDIRPLELVAKRVDVDGEKTLSLTVPTPEKPSWVDSSNTLFPVIGSFAPPFELVAVVAAPLLDGIASPNVIGTPIDLTDRVEGGTLSWTSPKGRHAIWFVFRHHVDHLVAGDAFPSSPAHARVVDHLDVSAARTWLEEQPRAWLDALAPLVPDEVFVDSFELVGELPWSDGFAARFAEKYGYSLVPNLPFALRARGESKYASLLQGPSGPAFMAMDDRGERVREDYEDLRGELFLESFVKPLAQFAKAHGTSLRLQGHGGFAHALDAYQEADIPESEGLFALGSMDFLELAASAAHVEGRALVSSESFVSVSPFGPALNEEEMWMLAGRAYTAGIQRLMFHGIAYPHARSDGSRWFPFHADALAGVVSAGPIDITSDIRPGEPAWQFLPNFNLALTRLTYALTRGEDHAEIAWLLHEREIPDAAGLRVGELPAEQEESATSLALRRTGYRYDRISPSMLARSSASSGQLLVGHARYRALLITDWHTADPAELDAVSRALDAGVKVVSLGSLPTRARGYAAQAARDESVVKAVSAQGARILKASAESEIARALEQAEVLPDITIGKSDCTTVSIAERIVANGHVFMLFNEHGKACSATLRVRVPSTRAMLLDPRSGAQTQLPRADELTVTLEAKRPLVLFAER